MIRCSYYDNGKCKALGDKIMIDCQTVRDTAKDVCKNDITNRGKKRYNKRGNKNRKNSRER